MICGVDREDGLERVWLATQEDDGGSDWRAFAWSAQRPAAGEPSPSRLYFTRDYLY